MKNQQEKSVIKDASTWRDAVCFLIDEKTNNMKSFSSGELTKQIREERPDLSFSHWGLGQYVRDLYYTDSMRYSDGYAYQVSRLTTGKSRTGQGVEVFVYSPSIEEGYNHNFEVEIPSGSGKRIFDEYGTKDGEELDAPDDGNVLYATIQGDGRLCIPRKAFELLGMNPGSTVYCTIHEIQNGKEPCLIVRNRSLNKDDEKSYLLSSDKGRIKFISERFKDQGFRPGEKFEVFINKNELVIHF